MIRANRYLPHLQKVVESFNTSDLSKWRAEWDEDQPLAILTEKEFDLLQFSPSPLFKINAIHELAFPINEQHARRQLETDIIGQYAVLENSVRHGYYSNIGSIDSRLRKFDSILYRCRNNYNLKETYWSSDFPTEEEIDRRPGIPMPTEIGFEGHHPAWVSGIEDKLKLVYELKQTYSKLLRSQTIVDERRQVLREQDRKEEYGFTPTLLDYFGRNVDVVLYGSATYQNGEPNDYDTVVLVNTLDERRYRGLEGFKPEYQGKPIDIVLVKKKEWEKFVVKNPFSLGIVKNAIVLHGEVEFPLIDKREAVLRSVSRAVGRIVMLHGVALNWASAHPEEIAEKEGLYASLAKSPRYVLGALLELKDLEQNARHIQYSKSQLEVMLAEMKIEKIPFPKEVEKIPTALFQIMADTAKIVDIHYSPRWIHQYQGEIEKLNNPSPEFLNLVESEWRMEKYLRHAWGLSSKPLDEKDNPF